MDGNNNLKRIGGSLSYENMCRLCTVPWRHPILGKMREKSSNPWNKSKKKF